jgi:hypothetical protein
MPASAGETRSHSELGHIVAVIKRLLPWLYRFVVHFLKRSACLATFNTLDQSDAGILSLPKNRHSGCGKVGTLFGPQSATQTAFGQLDIGVSDGIVPGDIPLKTTPLGPQTL